MSDLREKALKLAQLYCTTLYNDAHYGVHFHDMLGEVETMVDGIMALVQPVVTDEVVKAIEESPCVGLQWDGDVRVAYCDVDALAEVLTAALTHAVTRDDVIEELAVEAEKPALSWIDTEGLNTYTTPAWLARYFRSRKGGA